MGKKTNTKQPKNHPPTPSPQKNPPPLLQDKISKKVILIYFKDLSGMKDGNFKKVNFSFQVCLTKFRLR